MSIRSYTSQLTLFINTFNEEKNLPKALEKLKWIKNIIIVDSFSNDKTIEIAKRYTNKIFLNKFINFENQRNFSIEKIDSKWVLMIDADEILSPNAEQVLKKLIADDNIDGYWFPRRNYINSNTYLKHGYFYPDWQLRLFRNDKGYRFKGVIHARIDIPYKKTKKNYSTEIFHNPSRSKYNTFLSFFRFIEYIKKEGEIMTKYNISKLNLFKNIFIETVKHFYRSFIRKKGYLDGFYGFRAAFNFGLYQGAICYYALLLRLKNNT